jgi:hypothetical protein
VGGYVCQAWRISLALFHKATERIPHLALLLLCYALWNGWQKSQIYAFDNQLLYFIQMLTHSILQFLLGLPNIRFLTYYVSYMIVGKEMPISRIVIAVPNTMVVLLNNLIEVRENLVCSLLVNCLLHYLGDVSTCTCEILWTSVLHACHFSQYTPVVPSFFLRWDQII